MAVEPRSRGSTATGRPSASSTHAVLAEVELERAARAAGRVERGEGAVERVEPALGDAAGVLALPSRAAWTCS